MTTADSGPSRPHEFYCPLPELPDLGCFCPGAPVFVTDFGEPLCAACYEDPTRCCLTCRRLTLGYNRWEWDTGQLTNTTAARS